MQCCLPAGEARAYKARSSPFPIVSAGRAL